MKPVVILLHGLARGSPSMRGLERYLRAAGLETWNCDYPSTKVPIEEAADHVTRRLRSELPDRELYAVTHSMGGVVIRHLGDRGLKWRRIVMLAPPNRGSRVAWALRSLDLFHGVFGPAGQSLGEAVEIEKPWPFPPAPFAVIAGRRKLSVHNPTSWLTYFTFPSEAEHDGTVLVEEAKLEGMSAFATVDACHSTIVDDEYTKRLTLTFLQEGVLRL